MQPTSSFLIGQHPQRGALWAAIDPGAHHVGARVAETRFGGYMAPFRSADEARAALADAGAEHIEPEQRGRGKRGHG